MRYDSDGYLEMVNGLLYIALGVVYPAKNMITMADMELFAFL